MSGVLAYDKLTAMHIRRTIMSLILLVSFVSLVFGQQTQKLEVYADEDAYEVYSAVLSGFHRPVNPKLLVIRKETFRNFGGVIDPEPPKSTCLEPDPDWKARLDPAIKNFLTANQTKRALKPMFELKLPYKLDALEMFGDSVDNFTLDSSWKEFFLKHPDSGGFFNLSAVGFNSEKTIAVVSIGFWCGGLCGEGGYHVLEKKMGTWQKFDWKGNFCSWVS